MSGPSQPIHQGQGDTLILTKMMVIISISQTIPLTRKTSCQSSGPFVEKADALHLSVSSERGKNIRYEIGFGLVGGEDVQKICKTNTLRWPHWMHRKAHRQTCLELRQSLERIPSRSSLKWLFVSIVLKCTTAECASLYTSGAQHQQMDLSTSFSRCRFLRTSSGRVLGATKHGIQILRAQNGAGLVHNYGLAA